MIFLHIRIFILKTVISIIIKFVSLYESLLIDKLGWKNCTLTRSSRMTETVLYSWWLTKRFGHYLGYFWPLITLFGQNRCLIYQCYWHIHHKISLVTKIRVDLQITYRLILTFIIDSEKIITLFFDYKIKVIFIDVFL